MPRWLTGSLAISIAGDLEEERRRRSKAGSPIRAAIWFWRSTAAIVLYFFIQRLRDVLLAAGRTLRVGGRGEWRQAVRSLRRSPWYSLTVIGVIALSMTLVTTVFAIVDGVLFKPLPYPQPQELYVVGAPYSLAVSDRDLREWAAAVPEARMALVGPIFSVGSTTSDLPTPVTAASVGPGLFDVLGVQPHLGGFRPEHFLPSAGRMPILISHGFWLRLFGGDAGVLGKALDLIGPVDHLRRPLPGLQVVGVLPADFVFPSNRDTPDVILPLVIPVGHDDDRNATAAWVLARISAGVSVANVRPRIEAVTKTQGFLNANPSDNNPSSPTVSMRPLVTTLTMYTASSFWTAFVAATVLVLLAVLNVSSLALARTRQRRRELALREALGAGRWHVARLALREVAPLVGIGTALGVLGAPMIVGAVTSAMSRIPLLKTPDVDWRVLTFASINGLIYVLVLVVAMTRAAPEGGVADMIGRGAAVTRRRGPTFLLVSIQVAVTMVLAIGGVLVISSLWWAWHQDPGIDPERVVLLDVTTGGGSLGDRNARMSAILDRVRATPGVESLGMVGFRFLTTSHLYYSFEWPDGAPPNREEPVEVSGDFFPMLGIHALEGRLPTADDLERDADLAVISTRVARKHWPDQSAIGQTFRLRTQVLRTVAVVPDARLSSLDDFTYGQVYLPLRSVPGVVLAKARGNPEALRQALLTAIRSLPPPVGTTRALTLDEAYGAGLQRRRFFAWFFGGFAASALVIVSAGILGLLAMTTAMRTKEIGIRLALGATADGITRLLVREQMRAVAVGLVAGAVVAAWAVRYMKGYLYQFSAYDSRLWAIAVVAILVAATAGAFMPSWRASCADPVTVLRAD